MSWITSPGPTLDGRAAAACTGFPGRSAVPSSCGIATLWLLAAGVIRFDGAGDPGKILRTVLGYHQLDKADAAQAAEVCILTHAAMGQAGKTANKSIRWAAGTPALLAFCAP